jgi:hypothetical protein
VFEEMLKVNIAVDEIVQSEALPPELDVRGILTPVRDPPQPVDVECHALWRAAPGASTVAPSVG